MLRRPTAFTFRLPPPYASHHQLLGPTRVSNRGGSLSCCVCTQRRPPAPLPCTHHYEKAGAPCCRYSEKPVSSRALHCTSCVVFAVNRSSRISFSLSLTGVAFPFPYCWKVLVLLPYRFSLPFLFESFLKICKHCLHSTWLVTFSCSFFEVQC